MDSRFLQSLIAVIETGSIAAAAREQNLTAAAVSQRIKALENTLQTTLLLRSGHSAIPSDACLRLLPRAKSIVAQVSLLRGDLDPTGLTGEIKVGVISSLLSSVMPNCVRQLSTQAPGLLLQIVPGTSKDCYRQLLAQEIDIAIVVEPPFTVPKAIEQQHLLSQPLCFISAQQCSDIPAALSSQAFIQYDQQAWGGAIAKRYLVDHQLQVQTLCEIDALETISLMVASNMGVSLIPHWQGMSQIAANLQVLPIKDKRYQRNISMLSHKLSEKKLLVSALQDTLMQLSQMR
ncbi:MAG: LysR family transcriptional regulator [Oceanospirillaceae bacterium]|nr:LysR family transcriptional regulator [Oceanospirillaceae bacterium]